MYVNLKLYIMMFLTGPLYVQALVGGDLQSIRDEIIFHCGVGLNDVTPLSADVEIQNFAILGFTVS